jgi:hypothetical protein
MTATEKGRAAAWTAEGRFELPGEAAKVVGSGHPYLEEVAEDLVRLCHHPDAGTFVISGWRCSGQPNSFPMEFGAHAGPGPEETNGFMHLPDRVYDAAIDRPYVRNEDLRRLVRRRLARAS